MRFPGRVKCSQEGGALPWSGEMLAGGVRFPGRVKCSQGGGCASLVG